MNAEMVAAVAKLIDALAWPTVVLALILSQRKPIAALLDNLESFTLPGGLAAKIRARVDREAALILQADPSAAKGITDLQLRASERIQKIAANVDLATIRAQISEMAREYERTRASLASGDERTRRMELTTTKMRTLGLVAAPLLPELTRSSSPGERLAAVATLQVQPAADYLDWLAGRLGIEKPFIGYHAAVALAAAARSLDTTNSKKIEDSVAMAKQNLGSARRGTDRWRALEEAEWALREDL